jgi:hypothetical protein
MEQILDEIRKKKIKAAKPSKPTTVSNINTIKTCALCNETFPSKEYKKHIHVCKMTFDIGQNPTAVLVPPDTIKSIMGTIDHLKQRIDELEKAIYKQKKKVNILDWLNYNVQPVMTFQEFYYSLEQLITPQHLEYIFDTNYNTGMARIFKDLLPTDEEYKVPMRSYNEQRGTIYVYIESTTKQWAIMTEQQFQLLITNINRLLMKQLLNWKATREAILNQPIEDNEDEHKRYTLYKSKLLDKDMNTRKILYDHLKVRLTGAIEYEFTWS